MEMKIETIRQHASALEDIAAGKPARITSASTPGDFGWQGDLKVEVIEAIPDGYHRIKEPQDADRQLVPGNTTGSKHMLSSLAGVQLYWPDNWTHDASYDSYDGPCLRCERDATITHPTHGDVTIDAGLSVRLTYQRVWDEEQRRERRARD